MQYFYNYYEWRISDIEYPKKFNKAILIKNPGYDIQLTAKRLKSL